MNDSSNSLPPPPPPEPLTPPPSPPEPFEPHEKEWNVALHLSALSLFVLPFGNIVGPLIIWLFKRTGSPEIDFAGRQALNFQISITIYAIISGLLCFVLIGFFLLIFVFVLWLYGVIKAALEAGTGHRYTYPMSIPFFK